MRRYGCMSICDCVGINFAVFPLRRNVDSPSATRSWVGQTRILCSVSMIDSGLKQLQ
jgi:hypothetical protein